MGLVSQLLRLCLMILLLSQAYCRPGNRFHGHFTVRDHTGSLGVQQQPPPPPPPTVSTPPPPSLALGIPDDGPDEGLLVDQPRRLPTPPIPRVAGRSKDQPRKSPPPPMAKNSIRN